jgi:hypothetical protein
MPNDFSIHKNVVSQVVQYFQKTKPTFHSKELSGNQGKGTDFSGKWSVDEGISVNPVISIGNLLLSQFKKNKFDFKLIQSFIGAIKQSDSKYHDKNLYYLNFLEKKPVEKSDSSSDANSILNSIISIGKNPAQAQNENQLDNLVNMFNTKIREYLKQVESINPHGGKSFQSGVIELTQIAHKLFSPGCQKWTQINYVQRLNKNIKFN